MILSCPRRWISELSINSSHPNPYTPLGNRTVHNGNNNKNEDVSPIKNGDCPARQLDMLVSWRVRSYKSPQVGKTPTNPFEKYARQNGFIFPNFRGENKTSLSCHHLAWILYPGNPKKSPNREADDFCKNRAAPPVPPTCVSRRCPFFDGEYGASGIGWIGRMGSWWNISPDLMR